MFTGSLRIKFLLAFGLISAMITVFTLFTVGQRVQVRVREQIAQELRNSVDTFERLQEQREITLESSARLLATLPPVMAVMTSQDSATIQDASRSFWELSGSQLFVLADRDGRISALHSSIQDLARPDVGTALLASLSVGKSRDWWFADGHLFQVFLKPVSFGSGPDSPQIGVLALGFEVDQDIARSVARVASSEVAFEYNGHIVVTTVGAAQRGDLDRQVRSTRSDDGAADVVLGEEKFLATTVLATPDTTAITLTVLKSYDQATAFLTSLNRWIVGVGIVGVLAGGFLVFLVATSFTRPLAELVQGVRALEDGDFEYPLRVRGNDEVSTVTSAFDRMRSHLQDTQRQLLATERLATIGRMATSISHDLRHPLTAILAYAEFLSEPNISESQRKDFFQEIRIAVNRMTDELNSLLGFSKQGEPLRTAPAHMEDVIERSIQTVKVLPEFEGVRVHYDAQGDCAGVFDVGKMERVVLNLLFNAAEAVSPQTGVIDVHSRAENGSLFVEVSDNGPGIDPSILQNLFQPFVSSGKEQGIGLGLTVVQKVVTDHGGDVRVERTGPQGTCFVIRIPVGVPAPAV